MRKLLWAMMAMLLLLPQKMMADGTKPTQGDGTKSNPYILYTEDNLIWFRDAVNGVNTGTGTGTNICGKLGNDIQLTKKWTPIGTSSKKYTGTFYGRGATISGLDIESSGNNLGFFGYIKDADVWDMVLKGSMKANGNGVGSAVGRADGSSKITYIESHVDITMGSDAAKSHIGGIVGWIQDSTLVKSCSYTGVLDAGISYDCLGGIVGYTVVNQTNKITENLFCGEIKTASRSSDIYMGGILGYSNLESGKIYPVVSYNFFAGKLTVPSGVSTTNVAAFIGMPRGYSFWSTYGNTYLSGTCDKMIGNNKQSDSNFQTTNRAINFEVKVEGKGAVKQSFKYPGNTSPRHQFLVEVDDENTDKDYEFSQWDDGNTETKRTYSVTEDHVVTAIFVPKKYVVKVATNSTDMGTVSGGGTYAYGSTQTLTATPKTGYQFSSWSEGTGVAQSDGSNKLTITVPSGGQTYTATFVPKKYAITVTSNNTNMGTVTTGGSYEYGSTQTFVATPKTGYHFVSWSQGTGVAQSDGSSKLTITVPASEQTITATFAPNQYTIKLAKYNNYDYRCKLYVNGTESTGGTYDYGTKLTLKAVPDTYCYFSAWKNGSSQVSSKATFTYTVTGNATLTAICYKTEYTLTLEASPAAAGTVSGGGKCDAYNDVSITATPKTGYYFVNWTLNGATVSTEASCKYRAHGNEKLVANFGLSDAFAQLSPDGTTLTFKHHATPSEGQIFMLADTLAGGYPAWNGIDKSKVTKVVFDPSFAEARPTTCYRWFYQMSNLERIEGIANLNTQNVTDMSYMFCNCFALTSLNVSSFDTRNVTRMDYMFCNCSALTSLDVSSFDTRNVTRMDYMFAACWSLKSLDLRNINTQNVTNMNYMFSSCSALTSLDVSGFNTQNVTNMSNMFCGSSALTSLDVSGLNTQKVTDMSAMFNDCSALTSLDVSGFDTKNVTNMSSMFSCCFALTSLDVSGLNTQNVTNMSFMFNNCYALTSLDLSGFDTHNVTDMSIMFHYCSTLTSLDLSGFDTHNVTDMSSMFISCKNLTTIYASTDFVVNPSCNTENMFFDCRALKGGTGTEYDRVNTDGRYAHIDGYANHGYFTFKPGVGDVNGDGNISIADVTALTSNLNAESLTKEQTRVMDVDRNGIVNKLDVEALSNKILGK